MNKRSSPLIAAACLLLVAGGCGKTQKPLPATPTPPINVQVMIFKMPRSLAAEVLFAKPSEDGHEAMLTRIRQLAAEGKAALVATPSITTASGQRAVAESVLEVRYPTEFDPPQIPQTFGSSETTTTVTTTTTTRPAEMTGIPTAFETRNTGVVLECEPVARQDDKTHMIDMNLVVGFVALQGMKKFNAFTQGDKVISLDQPYFYTKKLTTSVSTSSGRALFVGTMEPDPSLEKEGSDFTEVVFVRPTFAK